MNLKLIGLMTKFANAKLSDLSPQDVRAALEAFDIEVVDEQLAQLLGVLQSADPEAAAIPWLQSKWEDGTIQQLITPDASVIFTRCQHCHGVNLINVKELQ